MLLLTQTEAAKRLGIKQPYIARLLKEGKLQRHGTKVDFDELTEFRNGAVEDPSRAGLQAHNDRQKGIKETITQAAQTPTTPQQGRKPTYAEAKTHRESFMAKLAELNYKEKSGQLIPVANAKAVIEAVFTPINAKLDELPIMLKSHFNEVSLEAMRWLADEINQIKTDSQGVDFE